MLPGLLHMNAGRCCCCTMPRCLTTRALGRYILRYVACPKPRYPHKRCMMGTEENVISLIYPCSDWPCQDVHKRPLTPIHKLCRFHLTLAGFAGRARGEAPSVFVSSQPSKRQPNFGVSRRRRGRVRRTEREGGPGMGWGSADDHP